MYYIYILSNYKNSTYYIGVTNNLERRYFEHKNKIIKLSFSSKYNLTKLVYYEQIEDIYTAISREKQLKNWKREWKYKLIVKENPGLIDLGKSLFGKDTGSSPV